MGWRRQNDDKTMWSDWLSKVFVIEKENIGKWQMLHQVWLNKITLPLGLYVRIFTDSKQIQTKPRDPEKPTEIWTRDANRWHEFVQWRLINNNNETSQKVIQHISDVKHRTLLDMEQFGPVKQLRRTKLGDYFSHPKTSPKMTWGIIYPVVYRTTQ